MTHDKDSGNMRLNHEEENIRGQGECRSSIATNAAADTGTVAAPSAAPAAAVIAVAGGQVAVAPKKVLPKACRHHVDESLGGAHHN